MTDIFAEPLDRLLADCATPERLRRFLNGATLKPLDSAIAELGYETALVDEGAEGLGLQLCELTAMLITLGRRLSPLPLGHTIVARALLARADVSVETGHILLLTPVVTPEGQILAPATPLALGATHALLDLGARHALVALDQAEVRPSAPALSLAADLGWTSLPQDAVVIDNPAGPLRPTTAALGAATIAGCIAGTLDLTASYASTRRQFGKTLIEFQAIQQQLAVLAEEAAATAMAAAIGCDASGPLANPVRAGIAKMRASVAAARASSIAHAIHGAIGFSEEYDLQLFTRRLSEERLANGGELYWAESIGRERLVDDEASTVAFVHKITDRFAD
jgi:acyl-CoA dehydrogenase